MAKKQPGGITNGDLSDIATQIFEEAFQKDGYVMFSLAETAIAKVIERKLVFESADLLFSIIRWNLTNELSKIEHLPDAKKIKLPDGRSVEETRLTQSMQLLENGCVDYFRKELVGFYEGMHITEISRSCSANMRQCEKAELWFLHSAFEECKHETDIRIKEASIEYEGKKATGYFDHQDAEYELTKEEKLLAQLCPLFGFATQDTKRKVWSRLSGFTRNQWALFLIEANPKSKDYGSKTEAAKALIKPNANSIQEISGLTNIRGIVIVEGSGQYAKDYKKVREIVQLLNADLVMRKSSL